MAKKQTRGRKPTGNRGAGAEKTAGGSAGPGRPFYLLLAVVVLGGVGWLLFARGGNSGQTAAAPLPAAADIAADPNSGVSAGPEDSPATIMEFFDFSCPACANFGGFTGRLIRQNYVENGGPARWVMNDYVLGQFPNSIPAAIAARCADEQGRYWEMHDLLLAQQTRWYTAGNPTGAFRDIANQIGLDGGAFRACMDEERHLETIMASRKYGDEMGVSSTPVLFFNGRRIEGEETGYQGLERLIKAALDSAAATADSDPE